MTLPREFVYGASTSAYQIEGAASDDGRGPSIWDTFSAEGDRIVDGSSGAVACDHYHRYAEDVALMRDLALDAYRFSISWSRVQPAGSGPRNSAGLDFYDRLVDELVAAGIRPMATLFHWDLPQPLQDEGGWHNRETALRFGEYADVVAERLADRVAWWVPVNEPNVVTLLGHGIGMHAPGLSLSFEALPVAHHLLLGHGLAAAAVRSRGAPSVGCATNHSPIWAASDSIEDQAAADLYDSLWNRLFSDPILRGRYPDGFDELMPVRDGDLDLIRTPLDFYGLNYYNPIRVGDPSAGEAAAPLEGLPFTMLPIEGYPTTDFGWPVVPDGLREVLVWMDTEYPSLPPVHITESGCAYDDGPPVDGRIHDQRRIDYLASHLEAVEAAIAEGVDVRGYFTWSLLDNWEWAEGFTKRFGLVHVDYDTQVRTPRDSYFWYRDRIAARR
jgi:beta-glucosidase